MNIEATAKLIMSARHSDAFNQEACGKILQDNLQQTSQNTDRELWKEGDYYADSIHVTQSGGIGINCGGHVCVKRLRDWHALAAGAAQPKPESWREIAREAALGWYGTRGSDTDALSRVILAAIERSHAAQPQPSMTDQQIMNALAAVVTTDKLDSRIREWCSDALHAMQAAQPQPSKASPQ